MAFITSFLRVVNPQVEIRHVNVAEETEKGKIDHEFVAFDVKNVTVSTAFAAKRLAKKMGKAIFPLLEELAKNAKDKDKRDRILKTKAWVDKKAVWHPALVAECAGVLLSKMRSDGVFDDIRLSYKEICTDVAVISILHDVGRLSEVDVAQGTVNMKHSGLNKNHAEIGFDSLKSAKIKPEILLAIKYHEFADVDEAKNDEIYINISEENKKIAELYIRILQDMDKTANLKERAEFGIKKCAEFTDPRYVQDYDLTEEYLQKAMGGNYLNLKGGHLLDAMMRFVTWTYSIHFKQTKEMLTGVLTDFFQQMYGEAVREYEKADDKDSVRLAATLEKITRLEDYAIAERMRMKIDEKKRQKIGRQIAELSNKALKGK